MLHPTVAAKIEEVAELCRRHSVLRLDLFGSATSDRFNPATSDFDFVVEFLPLPGHPTPQDYFGLKDDLEALLNRSVDLVSAKKIINPYFAESVAESRETVYVAA